jgi:hypothetical protein
MKHRKQVNKSISTYLTTFKFCQFDNSYSQELFFPERKVFALIVVRVWERCKFFGEGGDK